MSEDLGDYFRDRKAHSKKRRSYNRGHSTSHLKREGIPFTTKNDGAHLVVDFEGIVVDFWPGTGFWRSRNGTEGRGIRRLMSFLKDN
jgi:hypothetical protein